MADPIEVFFFTNRNLKPGGKSYGNDFHRDGIGQYRVGQAQVDQVEPKSFKVRNFTTYKQTKSASGDDEGAILGSSRLFRDLKDRLVDDGRDLIVLIHGYASDFDVALERAAQLTVEYTVQNRRGETKSPVVIAYSWPANGRTVPFASYISDRNDAEQSGLAGARLFMRLCDFLTDEVRAFRKAENKADDAAQARHDACGNRLHLVAHSMGNQVLSAIMKSLVDLRGSERLPSIFDNIFLMAADEDDTAMKDPNKLLHLPKLGNAVHIYHSKDDQALVISDLTKMNPDRLGSNGPENMRGLSPKIVTVDCRHVDHSALTHAVHQYYRLRDEVIADIREVLAGKLPHEVKGRESLPGQNQFVIRP